ncbi:MAG: CHASE2 domain-containing protein [Nitrospirota bacterium]
MRDIIRKYAGKKFTRPVQGIIIGLCTGAVALFLGMFQFAADLELYTVDMRYKMRPTVKTLPTLGYIDFNDSSIRLFGQWPWPRLRHAVLADTLNYYNARAAAFDVFFIERENTVFYPSVIKKYISSGSKNENQFLVALDDSFRNYDEEFAEAMTKYGNIYLSYYTIRQDDSAARKQSTQANLPNAATQPGLNTGPAIDLLKKTSFLPIPKDLDKNTLFTDIRIDPPLEEFITAAKGTGYAQPDLDSDSIVRHYTLLRRYDNYLTTPVILKMLSNIMDFKLTEMEIAPGKYLILKNALTYGGETRSDVKIPIDSHYRMPLNWAGTFHGSYTHIPYDVLSYFYAVIRAKNIASKHKGSSYTQLHDDIYSDLMEDKFVTEINARTIADEIATALFVSKYIDGGMKPAEINRQLKPYVKDDIIERVYAVVTASVRFLKDLKGGSTPDTDNSFAPQIEEARKNMNWFYSKNRLSDAYPYYFPETPQLLRNGQPSAFSPVDMEGMIFMIGLTGTNTMDLNPTPYEPSAPMVSFHLNAINTILTGQFLYTIPAALSRAITLTLAVLIAVVGIMSGVTITFAVTATAAAAYTLLTYKLWTVKGYRMDLVLPLLGMTLSYVTVLVIQFIRMYLERKKVRSIFAKMVSPAVLKIMEENPESFSLTGVRKAAAVFFSALNGMNEAISKVSPDELPGLLSIYLSPNSEIIMHYGGYIDKYEGHVIMADFGVPIDDELCAARCAFSAIEQRLDLRAFKFYAEAVYRLPVSIAMGFNYGYVSAGNMGSEEKFQYTVMGDPVNVAARFMAANFIYNSDYAITGEDAVPAIAEFVHLRLLDKLLLKGKTKPLAIYECIGWRPEAYLKLHSGKPVPAHVKDLWTKCPAGKIFGYLRLWENIYINTSHPLAKTIWTFFTGCIPVVEPLLINEWKAEAIAVHSSITAFKKKLKETHGQYFTYFTGVNADTPAQDLNALLSMRHDEMTRVTQVLNDPALTLNENLKEELASVSRPLINKCEVLISRLQRGRSGDDYISRCSEALSAFMPNATEEQQLKALIADGQNRYRAMAEDFYSKLSGMTDQWHEMMSLAGAPRENDLTAAKYFEEALNLYWQRRWDEAIEGFQKVLQYVQDDAPARSFINRIELYKETPPSEQWQGEFVQTKK